MPAPIDNSDVVFGPELAGSNINFSLGKVRLWDGSADRVVAATTVVADSWEHYVITRSGTSLTLSRNGVEDATGTWSGTFIPKAIARGVNVFLQGKIDEVAVYGTGLTSTQVKLNYDAGRKQLR